MRARIGFITALFLSLTRSVYSAEAVSISSFPVVNPSSPTVNRPWRNVPNTAFSAGEECAFVVKWGVITGGRSSLSIKEIDPIEGRPAYHLLSEARSAGVVSTFYKVYDRNDAWLDTQSLTTVRYEKRISEGKYKIEETVLMDQPHGQFHDHSYRIDKNSYEDKTGDLPPNALDVLGSLYFVRTLPLKVGDAFTFDVYSGGKVWPLVVKVLKHEKVKVKAGKFMCYKVEPQMREPGIFVSKGKKLDVWLTDDTYRMPVLMRSEVFIGHVSAELVSYRH